MKKTKHTPGPWVIKLKTDPLYEDGCIVESANDHEIRPDIGIRLCANEMDDLRLIAAAPDLLEALQRAINRQGFSNQELIEARAAIARATGEQA